MSQSSLETGVDTHMYTNIYIYRQYIFISQTTLGHPLNLDFLEEPERTYHPEQAFNSHKHQHITLTIACVDAKAAEAQRPWASPARASGSARRGARGSGASDRRPGFPAAEATLQAHGSRQVTVQRHTRHHFNVFVM